MKGYLILVLLTGLQLVNCFAGSRIIDGFAPTVGVKASHQGKYICYNQQQVNSWWEYSNGDDRVSWQSAVVPKQLKGQTITFRFAAGLGVNAGAAEHYLRFNGIKLFGFKTGYLPVAAANRQVEFRFIPLLLDKNNDIFGICELRVAPELIKFGQRQQFTVLGKKSRISSWFMLAAVPVPVPSALTTIQKKNKVAAGIAVLAAKYRRQHQAAATVKLCRWPGGRRAAISVVKTSLSVSQYREAKKMTLKFMPPDGFSNPFEAAVDSAVKNQEWLIIAYPEDYFKLPYSAMFKADATYLRRLDCLVWQASPAQIAACIKLHCAVKAELKQLDPRHLEVWLKAENSSDETLMPLTVQVMLPKGAWGGKVVDQRQQPVQFKFIVVHQRLGIQLSVIPDGRRTLITYNTKQEGVSNE